MDGSVRALTTVTLGLLFAGNAAAGPVRVRIETEAEPRGPFLVSINGRYASLDNGYSRHWKDVLVSAGRRHTIDLGFINPLLNMGVSVSVYHPEYVSESARSRKLPLWIRPVTFPDFRPRAWRTLIAAGESVGSQPGLNAGHVLGHLQAFLRSYLPAVDEDRPDAVPSDAVLRDWLPLFEELRRFAEASPRSPGATAFAPPDPERRAAYERALYAQDLEHRAQIETLLYHARQWLSLPREERRRVRALMDVMRTPREVGEELMTDSDLLELGSFLDRYTVDRAARRQPEESLAWRNPANRVEYRVHVLDPPPGCAYLAITTDVTGVVSADLGDMTDEVHALFCRRSSGSWRYGRP